MKSFQVELVNIGGADIVDGNHKLTLGLIWSIILHWQAKEKGFTRVHALNNVNRALQVLQKNNVKDVMKNIMAGLQQTNSEKILLSWVRQSTQDYQEVNVVNFTNSWSDGLAFNALIHSHRPDLFEWSSVLKYQSAIEKLDHAFSTAKQHLGIEKLLDPEVDVNSTFAMQHVYSDLHTEAGQGFMMELTSHQGSVGKVLQAGSKLLSEGKLTEDEENEIQEQMNLLNSRWENLRVASMERQSKLHEVLMYLQHQQLKQLEGWLTTTEARINRMETQPLGPDLEDVKHQVEEHKLLQEDLETEQVRVNSLTHMVVVVDESSGDSATAVLEEKLQCLFDAWLIEKEEAVNRIQTTDFKDQNEMVTSLRQLAFSHLLCFRFGVDTTELHSWMTRSEAILQSPEFAISRKEGNLSDLQERVNAIEREKPEKHRKLQDANRSAQALVEQMVNEGLNADDIKQASEQLNNRWVEFCQLLGERLAWLQYQNKILAFYTQLQQIEQAVVTAENWLRSQQAPAADPEPIKLQLEKCKDEVARLSALQLKVEKLKDQGKELITLAPMAVRRQQSLEHSIQSAQETDKTMRLIQESLATIDRHLTAYITDRIDAAQIPTEAQTIQSELSSHESSLDEMKKRKLVKETSERVISQIDVTQKKLQEVSMKFRLFQKPVNFEQRLLDCKRTLDDVKAQLPLLEMKSVEQDVLQSQLDQCMKFYKSLSEVKLEVETVIKTGRQIVQKQQTENPKELDERLTALKVHYNEMGAQVTEGKQDLEKCLKLSRKLRKEVNALTEWLAATDTELTKRSAVEGMPTNLDAEVAWGKVTEGKQDLEKCLKLSRKLRKEVNALTEWLAATDTELTKRSAVEGMPTNLDAEVAWGKAVQKETEKHHQQLKNISDLAEAVKATLHGKENLVEDKVSLLNCNWIAVTSRAEEWLKMLLDYQKQMEIFDQNIAQITAWMYRAEILLDESEKQENKEEVLKCLKAELNDIRTKVEAVRDQAQDLIKNRGEHCREVIEPTLTELNQRFEALSRRIKTGKGDAEEGAVKELLQKGENLQQRVPDERKREEIRIKQHLLNSKYNTVKNVKYNLGQLSSQVEGVHSKKAAALQSASPVETEEIQEALTQLDVNWEKLNKLYKDRHVYQIHSGHMGAFYFCIKKPP
ncbi:UNVERIFIED_CONTAM: hypothetical protein FKN15_049170 [Acipenser sinensis]